MTMETVGLSFQDAMNSALSEEEVATDIAPEPEIVEPVAEQPTVETEVKTGLLDSLTEQPEELETESAELYEVNGEMISLEQLRSGYMMQADYTQKTQEIANLQREAQDALDLKRLLVERPVETVRKLYQQISDGAPITGTDKAITPTPSSKPQDAPEDIDALIDARVAEKLASDPRLVALQQDAALAEVNVIFTDIEEVYNVKLTDGDKEQVLRTAQALDTTDLRFVFGGLLNKAQQKEKALANAKANATVNPTLAPDTPRPEADVKYDSFGSALRQELAEQGLE